MTDPDGTPPDPALLAELDAGLLDPERATAVRAAALADPRSAAVLAGLGATRAELAALPVPLVPPEVARRWRAALEAEGEAASQPGRPRPARLLRPLATAAVLVAVVAGLLLATRSAPPMSPGVVAVARLNLVAVGTATVGVSDLGALADPSRRAACLRAVAPAGTAPDAAVLGGRRVVFDGRSGVLLVLATGTLGRFRLLVVDSACGPNGGTLLAQAVVGA